MSVFRLSDKLGTAVVPNGTSSESVLRHDGDGGVEGAPTTLLAGDLLDITVTDASPTTPAPLEFFDGLLWGYKDGDLHSSSDNGGTWSLVVNDGPGAPDPPVGVLPCDDGEVLWVAKTGIYKSTGWGGGSPTWTLKVTANASSYFERWGVDGDGTKFIAVTYTGTRADSRYVWISTDSGSTFTTKWDTVAEFPLTHQDSHLHGACYDPWDDRFFFIEGHGEPAGIRYSGNDGASWTLIPPAHLPAGYGNNDWPPTTLTATDNGIVCGTDHKQVGILAILRTDDPDDMKVEWVWKDTPPSSVSGTFAWARRGFRDPSTGIVYIGYRSDVERTKVPPYIAASDGRSGRKVWSYDYNTTGTGRQIREVVVTDDGWIAGVFATPSLIERHIFARIGPAETHLHPAESLVWSE